MKTEVFLNYFTERQTLVEECLGKLVPEITAPYKNLFDASRYSLLGAGKRLRPILALATAETFNVSIDTAISACCTLEMIHTYSLIHDDLPSMDNDDFRRGKPSLHKAYPEGLAILAGDFLLTHAFETLAQDSKLDDTRKVKLIHLLAKSSGGHGMIAGQVLDIESEGKSITIDFLREIHRKKTGALIAASIEFGAILGNAGKEDLQALRTFGQELGLAFQIADDILDVTCSEKKHGKKISSDIINEKATYVSLLGLDEAKGLVKIHREKALEALKTLSRNANLLTEITEYIGNNP